MSSKITTSSLIAFASLPGIGLFLLLKQQGQIDIWKTVLICTGVVYLFVVARSFQNLYFGIAVAHVSFVSTLLWYVIGASEFGNTEQTNVIRKSSVLAIPSAVVIPVCAFQILAMVSQSFGNVDMDPCTHLMRSWLAVAILLSVVLLFGRQCYWRELNWFEGSIEKKATEETILFYFVAAFAAAMIYPFFLSNVPNPVRILFCMFQ
jgi:hypothetical protein